MEINLYNTLTRSKERLTPADPARVTLYVCGPTVYDRAHIGNARPAVVFDTLRRLLGHVYGEAHVLYARNITDIDDKIIARAAAQGLPISALTARYEAHYLEDMAALGVRRPDLEPHATTSIPAMQAMIATLIAKGHAYVAQGHVLFEVATAADYGQLSRRPVDEMIAISRVEAAPYKRAPADFVLWKPSRPDQPGWDSPWGHGRPGWHIECSAMIAEALGQTIDIHGGGLDLQFPHHENELAQSRCAHGGAPLAQIWMHNGFLTMADDQKMSKSLGNVITVDALLAQGWHGSVLRLALLSAQYRQPLEWSTGLLTDCKARLDRWSRALAGVSPSAPSSAFLAALADDLNTPQALAALSADVRSHPAAALAGLALLGIALPAPDTRPDARIEALVAERTAARAARDWATSDRIRDALQAENILLEDGPHGTSWRRG
jgi:cysteinyl-tRNA synthetase